MIRKIMVDEQTGEVQDQYGNWHNSEEDFIDEQFKMSDDFIEEIRDGERLFI